MDEFVVFCQGEDCVWIRLYDSVESCEVCYLFGVIGIFSLNWVLQ